MVAQIGVKFQCLCPPFSQPSKVLALLSMPTASERPPSTLPLLPHTRPGVRLCGRGGGCCVNALSSSPSLHRPPVEVGAALPFVTLVSYKYVCIVCASLLLYITLTFFVSVPGVLRQLQKGQPREEGIHACLLVSSPALGSGPAGGAGHCPWPRGWGGLPASSSTWLQSPNSTDWC